MAYPGIIEKGVLVGYHGYLFLAGGRHAVLEIITGKRQITDQSYSVFARNIAQRHGWAAQAGAKFLHIIFPDKQSIIPDEWPLTTPIRIGQNYVERCEHHNHTIIYPVHILHEHNSAAISKVDTPL